MLHERIDNLRREIIAYANHVELMIQKSMDGLVQKNREKCIGVIEKDEPFANEKELEIDDLCIAIIARYEPKAVDLRKVLMIMKMNNDLERMGDHAVNISESALYLLDRDPVKPLVDLPRMSGIVISMMNRCIEAYLDGNTKKAEDVCGEDSVVDDLRDQILRELITFMSSDISTIKRSIHLLRISSNLERIADLITNICEDVVFSVDGRVTKHHGGM